ILPSGTIENMKDGAELKDQVTGPRLMDEGRVFQKVLPRPQEDLNSLRKIFFDSLKPEIDICDYRAIIDAGAGFKSFSNRFVAESILHYCKGTIKTVIYPDDVEDTLYML